MAGRTVMSLILLAAAVSSLICPSSAQCSSFKFSENRIYSLCNSLPRLGSSLHWTYHPSNTTVDLAFRAPVNSPGWIAWGINPSAARMIGTQALVAVVSASGNVTAFPSPITSYSPSIKPGVLSFNISRISATSSGGIVTIFATILLPNNSTIVNHAWQSSTIISGDVPASHPTTADNVLSLGTLDFLCGESAAGRSNSLRKNVHGILCVVGWGVLTPLGVIISRYLTFPSFNFAVLVIQNVPYVIGVVGWAFGLVLGSESVGIIHQKHLIIGIVIFCLATLRGKNDYMNLKFIPGGQTDPIGISLVILSIINIFDGFTILGVQKKWRTAYIVFISTAGAIFLFMEVLYWLYYPQIARAIARVFTA